MVMGEEIQRVRSHYWLRREPDGVFHAYLSPRPGSVPLCEEATALGTVREMDIPGSRSKCCGKCCATLYPGIGYISPEGGQQ